MPRRCPFEVGNVYKRQELQQEFRGQRYGGIATPAEYPFVLCFTGATGRKHGYNDWWDREAGVLHYYGEGQSGDMEFTRGNKAIRDHAAEGEDLYIFEVLEPTFVKFLGAAYCAGYEERKERDSSGSERNVIVFELAMLDADAIEADSASARELSDATLEELREKAREGPTATSEAQVAKRLAYRRSQAVKLYVRARAAGSCEGCESPAPFVDRRAQPYLEPHHTRRLSDGGPDDPAWVIALCPTCHARIHYGEDGDAYNRRLQNRLPALEAAVASA